MMKREVSLFCGMAVMLIANMAGAQATNTFPSSGNVGIGTTNPGAALDVEDGGVTVGSNNALWINGTAVNSGGTSVILTDSNGGSYSVTAGIPDVSELGFSINSLSFYSYGTWIQTTSTPRFVLNSAGNVGIGTTNPVGSLDVLAPGGKDILLGGGSSTGSEIKFLYPGVAHFSIYNNGNGNLTIANTGAQGQPNGPSAPLVSIAAGGNVGIGTTSPAYNLDVAGKIHTSAAMIFADGSQQTTAWTGTLCGGDYAESVNVAGRPRSYERGDVLVIDPKDPGRFLKSSKPYSTSVLGIYSTKPGLVGRRQRGPKGADEVPMAMVGIVPTKVSAENGPIRPGDLLVTASLPGYAMRGTDRSRMLGAVIGKALGSLNKGTGVIEVGVTLQ